MMFFPNQLEAFAWAAFGLFAACALAGAIFLSVEHFLDGVANDEPSLDAATTSDSGGSVGNDGGVVAGMPRRNKPLV